MQLRKLVRVSCVAIFVTLLPNVWAEPDPLLERCRDALSERTAGDAPVLTLDQLLEPMMEHIRSPEHDQRWLAGVLTKTLWMRAVRYAPDPETFRALSRALTGSSNLVQPRSLNPLPRHDLNEYIEANFAAIFSRDALAAPENKILAYYHLRSLSGQAEIPKLNFLRLAHNFLMPNTVLGWLPQRAAGLSGEQIATLVLSYGDLIFRSADESTRDRTKPNSILSLTVTGANDSTPSWLGDLAEYYFSSGYKLNTANRDRLEQILRAYLPPPVFISLIRHFPEWDQELTARFLNSLNARLDPAQNDQLRDDVRALLDPSRGEALDSALLKFASQRELPFFQDIYSTYYALHPNEEGAVLVLTAIRAVDRSANDFVLQLIGEPGSDASALRAKLERLGQLMPTKGLNKILIANGPRFLNAIPSQLGATQDPSLERWLLGFAAQLTGAESAHATFDAIARAHYQKHPDRDALKMILETYEKSARSPREFARQSLFEPLPESMPLADLLQFTNGVVTPKTQEKLVRAAIDRVIAAGSLSRTLRRSYESILPDLRVSQLSTLVTDVAGSLNPGGALPVSDLLHAQNEVSSALQKRLKNYIQANAPPKGGWMTLIRRLPQAARQEFVTKLLRDNGTSTGAITALISALAPEDGVREAVGDFLAASKFSLGSRSEFSHSELKKMFGGSRLREFFPHVHPTANVDNGAIRTKFLTSLRTVRNRGLNGDWVIKKLNDDSLETGVPAVIGFRPALSYHRLTAQLAENFQSDAMSTTTPARQARGLVTQGFYERQGFTMMQQLTTRGTAHVEDDAEKFMDALEGSLRNGVLSRDSSLVRRMMVYGWAIDSSESLITQIRDRAAWIAGQDRGFWDLRVEIHNFPNHELLSRVRVYQERYRYLNEVDNQLKILIGEIEQLLGTSQSQPATLDAAIDRMDASDRNKARLKAAGAGFGAGDSDTQLRTLRRVRAAWVAASGESNSNRKSVRRYLGDHILSDLAQVTAANATSVLKAVADPVELEIFTKLVHNLLDHIADDDELTDAQLAAYHEELARVTNDRSLAIPEQRDMVMSLARNAVDQVFHLLEREFGKSDEMVAHIVRRRDGSNQELVRFIDGAMRSTNVFILSKLIDHVQGNVDREKNIVHTVGGRPLQSAVEVYNPGQVVGIVRVGKSPLELSPDEIAVFDHLPSRVAPSAAFVTTGVGARLSHLQLLAKSLRIPSVRVDEIFLKALKDLDGQRVVLRALANGQLNVNLFSGALGGDAVPAVVIPSADHKLTRPISFAEAATLDRRDFAGPKGLHLSQLFGESRLAAYTVDGLILPYGFFNAYARQTKLYRLIKILRHVDIANQHLVTQLAGQIREFIGAHPMPPELLAQAVTATRELSRRQPGATGFFVRSDTNVEDLPNFNGAGLNASVANVRLDPEALDAAIRKVWSSPFEERSISWRALALKERRVIGAEPSVVIMPTIRAQSSGVILSRGTNGWEPGKGLISADFGIGSAVESASAVEEINLAGAEPHRTAFSVSTLKPVANVAGGLRLEPVTVGQPVLTVQQILKLNELAQLVDASLGNQLHGWDIEWAIDEFGDAKILQARPNM